MRWPPELLAAQLPGEDPLEAFIGCGASGRTELFDVRQARQELGLAGHPGPRGF